MKRTVLLLILALPISAFAQHSGHGTNPDKRAIEKEDGLGNVAHPVTTSNADAQAFFDQGLAYLFAFNHDEAARSFKRAAELDPDLAMAYWGVSLSRGSNYNLTADSGMLKEAWEYLQKAIAAAPKASETERDYISALSKRYSADTNADRRQLAGNYRTAMGELVKKYPDDLDAATLYAESMMNLRPWQLWTHDGKPAEGTLEIVAVLEGVLRRNPNHSGANHYYIHAVEASPNPERALPSAGRLHLIAPKAGHLVHMPSHIYLRTGDYDEAARVNDLAIIADRNFMQKSGAAGFYPLMYYNHNIHMLAASHARNGNYAGAIKAARDLQENVAPNVKAMPMLEMFMPYQLMTLMRFRKWDEILKYPQPAAELKLTNAVRHTARGLAFVQTGRTAEAEKELTALRAVAATVAADSGIGNSPAHGVLKIADELLAGEIALAKGDRRSAIESLRRSATAEDLINYNEPPDWDLPVREWLGRALLLDGQYAEAEKAYREEIAKNSRNGRALFGLAEALRKQGKTMSAAMVQREFESAWQGADTNLSTDDFYQVQTAGNKPDGSN